MSTLIKAAPDANVNEIKELLGRMMFPGAAMEKKVPTPYSMGTLVLGLVCLD